MANRWRNKLTEVCKNGSLWWLRPDGTTRVTIEHVQRDDGSFEPRKIHTVVISTPHTKPLKAVRSKEVATYSGPEETAPSMAEITASGAHGGNAFSDQEHINGGQVCRVHLPTDGQIRGEKRIEQTVIVAAFTRDWRRQTPVYVW